MLEACPECGAPLPEGGSCLDHFHALLLEAQIPGVPGSILHFYAVAAYVLQHPGTMSYSAAALAGLRAALSDMLHGRATLDDVRRRALFREEGSVRITGRAGEPKAAWQRGAWPVTVADVCAARPNTREGYEVCVLRWPQSVCDTLDAGRS